MKILKTTVILALLTFVFITACNSKMTNQKNEKFKCSLNGNFEDIENFLAPINSEEEILLELTKDMYLFYNDSIKSKTYFLDRKKGFIESLKTQLFQFNRKAIKNIELQYLTLLVVVSN